MDPDSSDIAVNTEVALDSVTDHAASLVERGETATAARLLEDGLAGDPDAAHHALLGTVYLLLDRSAEAGTQFEIALQKEPESESAGDWRQKLEKAEADVASGVRLANPPTVPFDREALLAPPSMPPGTLPKTASATVVHGFADKALAAVARVIGAVAGVVIDLAENVAGKLGTADAIWTNWYHKSTLLAILSLAWMRERLNRENLKDTYPKGAHTGFVPDGLRPPPGVRHFRTADGSWNNLTNPKEGAAGVRFPRNVGRGVTWPPKGKQLLWPNPLDISDVLLARKQMKEVPFLNLLAASWIQFMVHGWVSHRMSTVFGVWELPMPPEHAARKRYHQTKMFVGKTSEDPTRNPADEGTPPTYINEISAWWDGSQIYGSDQATADSLRSRADGKLRLEGDLLPLGDGGVEHTGFNRNWWLGLSMLHTLFAREHNAICDRLKAGHPDWDDNRLYNVARLVNAAVMAKIHTIEWTPAILPNPVLYTAMNANWYGIVETKLQKRGARRVFPGFKIPHPVLGGILGNPIDKHGSPFGLSEEFTEVYRLHELLPDELVIRRIDDAAAVEKIALPRARQAAAPGITARIAMHDLFHSFGNQHPGQLVLNNYPTSLRQLSIPGNPVYDLAAVDILRARERGVPRYNEFRRQIGLKPIRSFEDLTDDDTQVALLKRVYQNDVEAIDLLVGNRAESHRPTGFGFGETMFQVFFLNASRRLQADRFYTDNYNEQTYTKEGLDWVDAADFKSVLLRHYPALARSGLANVQNAFEPWDAAPLDPARHPLRQFDA